MSSRSHSNLSIIEAVETLSEIADLEIDRDIGITQKHELMLQDKKISYDTVHWMREGDASTTVEVAKETFRVILHYLKQFYKKEYGYVNDPQTIEGIKTIMVLVGEAAKKLDKYTHLFYKTHQKSVTECKEYKQLQDFYLSKIARKIDEGVLGKWILALYMRNVHVEAEEPITAEIETVTENKLNTKHVFVDLETVKKDSEYDLFFIRKEDGSRFFSPRLLRNMKLVCDFGNYFGENQGVDPLENAKTWLDRTFHLCAKNILKSLGEKLNQFYHNIAKIKTHEVGMTLNMALIALMMSSHSHNLLRHHPIKSCGEYFEDFLTFLRELLHNRTYQKWLAYPPTSENQLGLDIVDFIKNLCGILYKNLTGLEEMSSVINTLIMQATQEVSFEHQKATQTSKTIWGKLAGDYSALEKVMKRHPNGPLLKVMDILEEDSFQIFDPLLQHNIPNHLFNLHVSDHTYSNLRFAAPVTQEIINKCAILEEFKGFLRSNSKSKTNQKHLLINLQDRTSWHEHARSVAIEELSHQKEFEELLTVVTLGIDTDFYHQLTPYHETNHANRFIKQFKEHLKDNSSGYHFPDSLNKIELNAFIDEAMEMIHQTFFSGKNVLSRESRLDFIEIFHLFLTLKLIDLVKPQSFSLTCKDGIDIGPLYNAEMYILMKLINSSDWSLADRDFLNYLLYAPALLIRERIPLAERFNRMISAVKVIENARNEIGQKEFSKVLEKNLSTLFKGQLARGEMLLQQ